MMFIFYAPVIAVLAIGLSAAQNETRGRIFNGQASEDGHYKFMAYIMGEEKKCCGLLTDEATCGGAIIHQNWVLTAAHCLDDAFRVTVYLGALNTFDAVVAYKVNKNKFVFHKYWNRRYVVNDIALVEIPTTLACDKINYAPLPNRWVGQPINVFKEKIGIIMGWGLLGNHADQAEYLQKAEVAILGQEQCQLILPFLTDVDMCVDTDHPYGSICKGDSGGPLILADSGELVGVASFIKHGVSCEDGYPAVFVRVLPYMPWINEVLGNV